MDYIPKLKDNIELVPFDTSHKEQTYIVIHEDRRWHVLDTLYHLMILIDGKRTVQQIAQSLSEKIHKTVTCEEVEAIIERMLKKNGLLECNEEVEMSKNQGKNKYMWLKIPLLKPDFIEKFRFLSIFFHSKAMVILTVLSIAIQLHAYIGRVTFDNFYDILRLNSPNILAVMIIVNLSTVFHEFGHMAAFMKYGLKPGNIGFAIYLTMPVLYSDVNSSWKLKRTQRAVIDIGGVYFAMVYCLLLCLIGVMQNNDIFVFASFIIFIFSLGNFNPFLKMDGYWLVSDLLGIPNLHKEVKGWIASILYRLLKINTKANINEYKKKEASIFYVYSIFTVVYTMAYTSGIFIVLINMVQKVPVLADNFSKINGDLSKMLKFTTENFGTIFMAVIMCRLIYISIKNLIKLITGIQKVISSSKEKSMEMQETTL